MADDIRKYQSAVDVIKTAILQSQARAAKAVNQEQLALYYGIGRYISGNTRNIANDKGLQAPDNEQNVIRQLQLMNYTGFPLAEFLSISFTHHIAIITHAMDFDERLFYIRYCHTYKPTTEDLPGIIKKQDLYHHQDKKPNNFLTTIPDYKQAYRAIRMFKDEYLLDFINVEELGMHDEDYAGYIMQDFRQPMGVATYKTADEMDPELLKALPPKEELQRVFKESSKKEE